LIGSVSKLALKLVKEEWERLTNSMTEVADANLIDLGLYAYELLARYGLPCKHHLLLSLLNRTATSSFFTAPTLMAR
jgi:hypothetical protein